MGGKIKKTKLNKQDYPYELTAAGKTFVVKIVEDGSLHIFTENDIVIKPYTPTIIVLRQDD